MAVVSAHVRMRPPAKARLRAEPAFCAISKKPSAIPATTLSAALRKLRVFENNHVAFRR
jgi:hypothetical protein